MRARQLLNSAEPTNGDRSQPPNQEAGQKPPPRIELLLGKAPEHLRRGPWRVLIASLIGLVVAIVVAGFVGLAFNQSVHDTTQGALVNDIDLQDDADDLRVAILDVRHHHRNLMFYGPTNDRLIEFQNAHAEVLDEIAEIEETGFNEPGLPQPQQLRQMSEEYYALFRPALDLYASDPAAFEAASNHGLTQLAALQRSARQLDDFAEREADLAVARIEQASSNARLVLFIVIGGLVLVGAALIYASFRVIKEIHRLYEAEQAASLRLSGALQAKNDFIADASHELPTPLTVLRGNAEAGLVIEPNCAHGEILKEIVEESTRMTRLVDDLLFLARSDAASPPLDTEIVAIEPLLRTVAERAEVLAYQRGTELVTGLTAAGTVSVDAARIEQAVLALVDNAAKFSFPGGRVKLTSSTDSGELIVEVSDQGPGIPEAELPLIFDRFYRTDRTRIRRRGGAGLGLSIARTIVEAHGGRIRAYSKLGNGTQMQIVLPLDVSATPDQILAFTISTPELAIGRTVP